MAGGGGGGGDGFDREITARQRSVNHANENKNKMNVRSSAPLP